MKRSGKLLLATAVAAALVTVLGLETAAAQATEAKPATDGVPTTIKLSTTQRSDEKGKPVKGVYVLSATLATADGKPVNNRSVEFYQQVDLMGPRESYLGEMTTDSTGAGGILFQASQAGPQSIKAYFTGSEGYAATNASTTFDVSEVVPPLESEPLALAFARKWLPIGLGGLVVLTWAILLGGFLVTAFGIKGASQSPDAGRLSRLASNGSGKTR